MDSFIEQLMPILQEKMGGDYEITQVEVTKVNNCKYKGLVFRDLASSIGVTDLSRFF